MPGEFEDNNDDDAEPVIRIHLSEREMNDLREHGQTVTVTQTDSIAVIQTDTHDETSVHETEAFRLTLETFRHARNRAGGDDG